MLLKKKTNSISALSQYENNYISNDFVKLWLSEDGEFAITTTGGDPVNSNDNNKDLLFGYTNSEVLKFGSKSMEAFDSSWSDTSFEENHVKST